MKLCMLIEIVIMTFERKELEATESSSRSKAQGENKSVDWQRSTKSQSLGC